MRKRRGVVGDNGGLEQGNVIVIHSINIAQIVAIVIVIVIVLFAIQSHQYYPE